AHGIKIEGASEETLQVIRKLTENGIPVMGHVGLTPQFYHMLGGFKVQGKAPQVAEKILKESKALAQAGCFSLVLECVPSQLAQEVTRSIDIPTIGIGAGPFTDGQILVWHDVLGMNDTFKPKFVRSFAQMNGAIKNALNAYVDAVIKGEFPSQEESFS
ncbi:MAG: 3-methyl-2-oxobutanoate hydroxymethyltransferase, partial [Bdellovibrionaceae bacterium]|nr:3-methyl-2-oxobutanoate hydroxymethyltransferase [Pseudobdellovibrionaceae bacterium]